MWQDITRDEKTLRPCFYVKHAGYDVISSPGNRKKVRIMKNLKEQLMHMVFLLSACVSILCVAMICVFLFANGIPAIGKIGIFQFLAGEKWKPGNNIFGILPMILGSIYVTAGAVLIGVPIGILTAVFMSRFCPKPVYKVVKPAIDLLAGIPSVVYGWVGLTVLIPAIKKIFGLQVGHSILAAGIVLALMIFPTISNVAADSISSVPKDYRMAAYGLGSTRWQSIYKVVLPAAGSGILSGIILGLARAFGEALAVAMVIGQTTALPTGIFSTTKSLTTEIAAQMGNATEGGEMKTALWTMALLLFVLSLVFILLIHYFSRPKKDKE